MSHRLRFAILAGLLMLGFGNQAIAADNLGFLEHSQLIISRHTPGQKGIAFVRYPIEIHTGRTGFGAWQVSNSLAIKHLVPVQYTVLVFKHFIMASYETV